MEMIHQQDLHKAPKPSSCFACSADISTKSDHNGRKHKASTGISACKIVAKKFRPNQDLKACPVITSQIIRVPFAGYVRKHFPDRTT
jgi:hypothetical protein